MAPGTPTAKPLCQEIQPVGGGLQGLCGIVLVWAVLAVAGNSAVEDKLIEVVFDLVIGPCNRRHHIKTEVF